MSYVSSIFNFNNNKTILSKGLNVQQYQNIGLICVNVYDKFEVIYDRINVYIRENIRFVYPLHLHIVCQKP